MPVEVTARPRCPLEVIVFKSIDDQNMLWPYDDRLNRGVSNSKSNDVRHTVSAAYTYELPFGTGQRWL